MTQYLVFGWSDEADKDGPADRFLGTTVDDPHQGDVDNFTFAQEPVRLTDNLLFGKECVMEVMRNRDGLPIMAYFPILRREEYNERGLING